MSVEDRFNEITLEDVDVAINILQYFLSRMRKAQYVLSQVQREFGGRGFGGYGSMSMNDILNMAWEIEKRKMQARGEAVKENVDVGELPPEEVAKMKDLVKKYRSKS